MLKRVKPNIDKSADELLSVALSCSYTDCVTDNTVVARQVLESPSFKLLNVHYRINHFAKLLQKQGSIRVEKLSFVLGKTILDWMEEEKITSIQAMKERLDNLDLN